MKRKDKIKLINDYVCYITDKSDWESLINWRHIIIHDYAALIDVKQDYLTYNTDFWRGIQTKNQDLCIDSLIKAINRINELKNK